MSYEPSTPPSEILTDIVDTLNGYSPDQLQYVARYAEELAEHKAREARLEEESNEDEINDRPNDLPDDVPPSGHLTDNALLACQQVLSENTNLMQTNSPHRAASIT